MATIPIGLQAREHALAGEHKAWDVGVRAFHWINLAALLWLTATGLCILYENELALPTASRVAFKTVHKWGGYVFAINLAIRIAWGLAASGHGRWSRALPLRRGFGAELRDYLASLRRGEPAAYVGHNPLGSLMVMALLVLLTVQAVTGLILAGTDLYQGPFGSYFANWVAGNGVDPASLIPGDRTKVDPKRFAEMRAFRSPVVRTHEYVFYAIVALSALHVIGVVHVELRTRVALVSAMITGRKRLASTPVDER